LLDATGDDLTSPKPTGEAPKSPKESADVVKAVVKLGEKTPKGDREFTLTLTMASGWHIYANPVENDTLAESQTEVTVMSGKTALMTKVTYPKGKIVNDSDPMIGKYVIYEGTTTISGTIPTGKEDLEFRVKVNACTEKTCLLQSVLKIKP
jgi:hypothetical protein